MMQKNKCLSFISILLLIATYNVVFAQDRNRFEISSSFNPVGSGARALGQGGAFIAMADDGTAPSWNPGALLEAGREEIVLVGAIFSRTEDGVSKDLDFSTNQTVNKQSINYLSYHYPFNIGIEPNTRDMALNISYQYLYEFKRNMKFSTKTSESNTTIDYEQDGSLSAYGLSYAFEILDPLRLAFGLTLNLWENGFYKNGWQEKINENTIVSLGEFFVSDMSKRKSQIYFNGTNYNLGMLWKFISQEPRYNEWRLGAVLKSRFRARLDREEQRHQVQYLSFSEDQIPPSNFINKSVESLDMPLSYGIGIGYWRNPDQRIALDIYKTEWQNFTRIDAQGNKTNAITGLETKVEPTTQIRIGGQYKMSFSGNKYSFRGGIFYDPAPAIKKVEDIYGASLGVGVTIKKHYNVDFAYQYRWGDEVGNTLITQSDYSQKLQEHLLYFSITYYIAPRVDADQVKPI